jgi:L-iditol 2-dehydrogenase
MAVEQVEIPKAGPGEIVVRVAAALTCGTDLKSFRRGHPLVVPPTVLGHEFAGTVVETGKGADRLQIGARVAAANSAPCGACFYCRVGKPNLCERLAETLLGFSVPGSYAEYVKIPARIVRQNTFEIPPSLAWDRAALLEPLACVVHGNELAEIGAGDTVAVIGAGPIGLLHIQLARLNGAGRVIAADLQDARLEDAKRLGADVTVNTSIQDLVKEVSELSEGRGADVTIEAAGHPKTWETAVKMTRKGGTTVLFGGCPSGTGVTFDTGMIHYGELTIKGAFHHTPSSVERAYRLLARGVLKTEPLITRGMPLEEVVSALEAMGRGEVIKVAVKP